MLTICNDCVGSTCDLVRRSDSILSGCENEALSNPLISIF